MRGCCFILLGVVVMHIVSTGFGCKSEVVSSTTKVASISTSGLFALILGLIWVYSLNTHCKKTTFDLLIFGDFVLCIFLCMGCCWFVIYCVFATLCSIDVGSLEENLSIST